MHCCDQPHSHFWYWDWAPIARLLVMGRVHKKVWVHRRPRAPCHRAQNSAGNRWAEVLALRFLLGLSGSIHVPKDFEYFPGKPQ